MQHNIIDTGSDFSGVGAFDQALERLGIEQNKIFACDMDKYARVSYVENYGEPDYYPENVYDRKIPEKSLDIYMTSPPCQAFSIAGKRGGEEDERGVLFYNSHEFIDKNKPRFFIFENVKGLLSHDKRNKKAKYGNTFSRWIEMLGGKSVNGNPTLFPDSNSVPYHIYWKVLNATDFDIPQNRERVFIVGVRDDSDNKFTWPKEVQLSKRLKDVLEEVVDEKYFLSDTMVKNLVKYNERQVENGNGFMAKFRDVETTKTMSCIKVGGGGKDDLIKVGYINQDTQASQVYSEDGKSPTLSAGTHGYANGYVETKEKLEIYCSGCDEKFIGELKDPCKNCGEIHEGTTNELIIPVLTPNRLEKRQNGRRFKEDGDPSFTITTQDQHGVLIQKEYTKGNSQAERVYDPKGVSSCLSSEGGGSGAKTGLYEVESRIRRLTPRECMRLQDFPDSYKIVVSDTQAYKQAGNSIAVGVLAAIIKQLNL